MGTTTIPFGPDADPLGLEATEFEFVSLDGPQYNIENEEISTKKDGSFLRFAATRELVQFTAHYTVLNGGATPPARGLYDASAGGIGKVWIRNASINKPQAGDWTMAVQFVVPADLGSQEALRTDFGLS